MSLKTLSGDLPYDIIRKAGNSSTAVIEAQKDTSASHIKNLLGTKLADVKSDRDIDLNLINFKSTYYLYRRFCFHFFIYSVFLFYNSLYEKRFITTTIFDVYKDVPPLLIAYVNYRQRQIVLNQSRLKF